MVAPEPVIKPWNAKEGGGGIPLPSWLSAYGQGRIRTGDTTIFSRVLYQLSYLAW